MTRPIFSALRRRPLAAALGLGLVLTFSWTAPSVAAPNFPVTEQQRGTAQKVASAGVALSELAPNAPDTYTVGVTDYTFNTTNAIYGRALKTPDGHVVTMAYWQQKEDVSHDEIPYYEDVK